MEITAPAPLAKIRKVDPSQTTIWFEFPNGNGGSASSTEAMPFEVGDVVYVGETLEAAPDDLWPDERFVGVVRVKHNDVTVIDSGGRWQRLPTDSSVNYRVGNTVEARPTGVIRVLQEAPISLLDLQDLDESVLVRFRSEPTESGDNTFDSLGGLDEVIQRSKELIELPLREKDKLSAIGAAAIKGVLFTGPSGTGKTKLARIIAARSGATFYAINGPEVFSKWYGQSEELLRLIFEDARKQERSIIFFDEIDSVAAQRTDEAHEASRRVVAQLLTLMDGFEPNDNVIVLATTNRPGDIDEALRRPGRLDWEIHFGYPNLDGRRDILKKTAKRLRVASPLPLDLAAHNTDGWSGAELVAIWNEAALLAVSDDRDVILAEDFLGGWHRVSQQRSLQSTTLKRMDQR
jgi:transitional endoplasmic reticulum ATPase